MTISTALYRCLWAAFLLTAGCIPLQAQGWWIGPVADFGAVRSFSLTGLATENETRFAAGLGGFFATQPMYFMPEYATDGETHVAGLGLGGMFWERFGIGLKANLLFDRFETVLEDPMGNPLPALDNDQSYFMVGGQLVFLTARQKQRSPVISLGFSLANNGLFWGQVGLGYAWHTGGSKKE